MAFVRTVLGDIDAGELGITYAHEHLVIDRGRAVELYPDFDLSDVATMATEVRAAATLGLRTAVDAMPCDTGRNVRKLAELSRLTGVNIVAPTGLHHERFYPSSHWRHRIDVGDLADLFAAEVVDGIDELDYSGPVVRRSGHRAGVIKIAGSDGGPSHTDTPAFEAAAIAHTRTGVPILTHCENGTGALEQVALLTAGGVESRHIVLSHVDKVVDRGYHREVLASGAFVEYDGSFRWGDKPNGTLQLLEWMAADGLLDHVLLGMDAARQGYYHVYGGEPGLTWLLDGFRALMDERGLGAAVRQTLFVRNPARAFAFAADNMDGGDAR